jgi:hypothetical protein
MAKETRKESKGKPKKAATKAPAATVGTGAGKIATSTPSGGPGANVKPNPGAKR